jgi:hypothetical protein
MVEAASRYKLGIGDFFHSWELIVVLGAAAIVTILLLHGPVVSDRALARFGTAAMKVGPKILLAGTAVLILGILVHVVALMVIGGASAGIVLLGLIAWNYLPRLPGPNYNAASSAARSSMPSDPSERAAMCQAFRSKLAPRAAFAASRPASQARSPSL